MNPKKDKLILISGADIEPEPVSWLWRNWLQLGAFNLLAGQSTAGKSTIALSLAAVATRGFAWPDSQNGPRPGNVIFWSGEDGVRDTLLPRFLAAGGDRTKIFFIDGVEDGQRKRPFNPASDMSKLVEASRILKRVQLIVLDPIAVVVRGDSHKNVETRVGLQPFADLCADTGACGLGVHHFTKNTAGGNPLERVSGSLAFHAMPRVVLVAARDQNGGEKPRRVLMRAKVSNGPDWGGLDYDLDRRRLEADPKIEAQRVLWGAAIEGSARELLAQFEAKKANMAQRRAVAFLMQELKDEPREAAELYRKASKLNITESALRYAYRSLGGVPERHGSGRKHYVIWELPKEAAQ
jgi:putative DNA primase/helicase